MQYFIAIKNFILDILFPRICVHCGAPMDGVVGNPHLCPACAGALRPFGTFFCPSCKARLPDAQKTCHPAATFMLGACLPYNDQMKALIHQLKYRGWKSVAATLRPHLRTYLSALEYRFEGFVVMPVPLHPVRKRERGFNQAELIADEIARILNLPLDTDVLIRTKRTKSQAELRGRAEREKNVSGAFEVRAGTSLAGKKILIVDDVFTSGSTLTDAVRALRAAGARKVIAITVAKA